MAFLTSLPARLFTRMPRRRGWHWGRTITREDTRILKAGNEVEQDHLIVAIIERSAEPIARARVRRIEADMRELTRRLRDVPTDPAPLPSTRFRTESDAVAGCATPEPGSRLLYAVTRVLRPREVVEIGAAHGYGACYIAAGLRDNGFGRLRTLEGMNVRVRLSRETIGRLGYEDLVEVVPGDFRRSVPAALTQQTDLVFSDGDKAPALTEQHFALILRSMVAGGWILFDDIDFSPDIRRLIAAFVAHPRTAFACSFFDRWALLQVACSEPPLSPLHAWSDR